MIKNNNDDKTRNRRNIPQPDKGHLQKPTANIMLNEGRRKALPTKISNKTGGPLSPLVFNIVLRGYEGYEQVTFVREREMEKERERGSKRRRKRRRKKKRKKKQQIRERKK